MEKVKISPETFELWAMVWRQTGEHWKNLGLPKEKWTAAFRKEKGYLGMAQKSRKRQQVTRV